MKSPKELSLKLAQQWGNSDLRAARLLGVAGAWPISLPIGKPKPGAVTADLDAVKQHLDQWRQVRIGSVTWESTSFRAASEAVDVPTRWELQRPTQWIDACSDRTIRAQFDTLSAFVEQTDPLFHSLLIRRRFLWRERPVTEVVKACRLALVLQPGCAAGKPLRALAVSGNDTKFIERNQSLLTALLDARFDGEVSHMGLHEFLGAALEDDHWLLVADLDGHLLPFRRQRISSSELKEVALPGRRLLIVENERSLHQLPTLPDTTAVLGAGLDLEWTTSKWLLDKKIAYWGDIDTWGLQCLAKARSALPHVKALLMTLKVFQANIECAVPEPVHAGTVPPRDLNAQERALYEFVIEEKLGRLEQEFLPLPLVHQALTGWGESD